MQNSVIQAAVRYLTGNAGQFNEDLHALADMLGVSPGTAEARLAAVLSLPPANVYAALGECGDGVFEGMVAGAVLKKYGASLILPGDGVNNGFATGNYLESTGQTYASIDDKVGLVTDAAGSLGPELVVNGDFSNGTTGWTAGDGTQSVSNSELTITATGASYPHTQQVISCVVGKTYVLTATARKGNGTSTVGVQVNGIGGAYTSSTSNVTLRYQFVASFTTYSVAAAINGPTAAGDTATFDNISVRELTGIHALQATDGYKPLNRRGLVNLLTYSNDFSNAAWAKEAGSTPSPTRFVESATSAYHRINDRAAPTLTVGNTYTYVVRASYFGRYLVINLGATLGVKAAFDLQSGAVTQIQGSGGSVLQLADGSFLCCITGVCAAQGERYIGTNHTTTDSAYLGDGVSGVNLFGAALFQGTVTAQQILDAGGIPVTTTDPKSSSLGARYWQFDSIDDKLQLNFPVGAGWNSATIVQARETGAVTLTGQNVEGTYYITGGGNKYGEIFVPGSLSASELAILQKFANALSKYTGA